MERLKTTLNTSGCSPHFLPYKWIHNESSGVIAVDQGQSKNRKEIRAYIFPDEENKFLYLLTIGDKNSQKRDNNYCRELVGELKKGTTSEEI